MGAAGAGRGWDGSFRAHGLRAVRGALAGRGKQQAVAEPNPRPFRSSIGLHPHPHRLGFVFVRPWT